MRGGRCGGRRNEAFENAKELEYMTHIKVVQSNPLDFLGAASLSNSLSQCCHTMCSDLGFKKYGYRGKQKQKPTAVGET